MKKVLILTTLLSQVAFAHNVQLNQSLPSVNVSDNGELIASNGDIKYKKWNSGSLAGKVRIVNHFAGRSSAKEKGRALVKAIRAAKFNRSKYQTTSIINADDAMMGTGILVKNKVEKGKLKNAFSQVVLDQNGSVKKAWNLKAKDNFVAVLDKTGKVRFVAEGELSQAKIKEVIQLVKSLTK